MKCPLPYREIAGLLAGFTLWASCFVVLYAMHGFVCATSPSPTSPPAARALLAATLAVFVAAHAILAAWFWRRRQAGDHTPFRQLRRWSFVLALAALPTTILTGLPVLTLSLCT